MIRIALIVLLAVSVTAQEYENGIDQTGQVTKGLVSYWSMRNSGTTVCDEWGSNNGTASNGVVISYENGVVNNGASFDGTNDYISLPANILADAFSVSGWFKLDASGRCTILGVTSNSAGTTLHQIGTDSSTGTYFQIDTTFTQVTYVATRTALQRLVWNHMVLTRNASTFSLYLNGSDITPAINNAVTNGIRPNANSMCIGRVSTFYSTGQIDETRIYKRALTYNEVKQLYRMGATLRGIR
jgi:hypothetical protein